MKRHFFHLYAATAFFTSACCFLASESGLGIALLGLGGVLNLVACWPSPEAAADGEGE